MPLERNLKPALLRLRHRSVTWLRSSACVIGLLIVMPAAARLPAGTAQAPMTEPQVRAFLDSMDRAAESLNTDAFMANFSDDCIITLEMPGPDGAHRFRWNKEEYARQLEESAEETEDYALERTDTAIELLPDGRSARVTMMITETIRTYSRAIHTVTKEETRLELRNGKLIVTRVDDVVITFEQRDAVDSV